MSGAIPKRSQRVGNTPLHLRRTSPPPNRTVCTCPRGLCVNCRCTQSNYFCSDRCNCNPDRCRNRPRIVTPVLWPLARQEEAVEPQRPPVIPVEEVNIPAHEPGNPEEEAVEPQRLPEIPFEEVNILTDDPENREEEVIEPPLLGAEANYENPVPNFLDDIEDPPPAYSPPPEFDEATGYQNPDNQPESMEIAAAIRDLLRQQERGTNQLIQENRAALTHQIQAQQDVLDQLVARIVAQPAPAPQVNVPAPAAVPVRAILGAELGYDGKKGDAVVTWLQRVNQKALAEGWADADTLRAAIGALSGKALDWQAGIGHAINNWTDWSTALLTQFDIKLNEFQWMLMVEGRKQLPNESGSDYALTKRTMIVRRATPVTNQEMVRALIRGLNNSDHRAAMLNNEPANLTEFIAEINRLEGITKPPLSVDEFSALLPLMGSTPLPPPAPAPTPQPEPEQHTIQSIGTALKEMCARLEAVESRQVRPAPFAAAQRLDRPWQGPQPFQRAGGPNVSFPPTTNSGTSTIPQQAPVPPTQTAIPTQPRPTYSFPTYTQVENRTCYRCNLNGHIGRDCPAYPGPAQQRPGNGPAGPTGPSGQRN